MTHKGRDGPGEPPFIKRSSPESGTVGGGSEWMFSVLGLFRSSSWLSAGNITALKMPHHLSVSLSGVPGAPTPPGGQAGEGRVRAGIEGLEASVPVDRIAFLVRCHPGTPPALRESRLGWSSFVDCGPGHESTFCTAVSAGVTSLWAHKALLCQILL